MSKETSLVIATGGGAVLRFENADALSQNGRLIFIDASIEGLIATSDRPLSSTPEKLRALYETRYPIYCERCDIRVEITRNADENADKILSEFGKVLG